MGKQSILESLGEPEDLDNVTKTDLFYSFSSNVFIRKITEAAQLRLLFHFDIMEISQKSSDAKNARIQKKIYEEFGNLQLSLEKLSELLS